jgi:hypothetical protein
MILAVSLEDDAVFHHCTTADYPEGLAWLVWQDLMDEYDLTDGVTSHQLRLKLLKLTMKRDGDPYVLSKEIWCLQQRSFKSKAPITNAEAVTHYVNQLPKFYMVSIVGRNDKMEALKKEMTVKSLGVVLRELYRQSHADSDDEDDEKKKKKKKKSDKTTADT